MGTIITKSGAMTAALLAGALAISLQARPVLAQEAPPPPPPPAAEPAPTPPPPPAPPVEAAPPPPPPARAAGGAGPRAPRAPPAGPRRHPDRQHRREQGPAQEDGSAGHLV